MKKILIIEDDLILREEMQKLLQNSGYETKVLETFSNIVEDILDSHVDMVLLDINIPQNNGEQVLKNLRLSSSVPVIMVTSCNRESDEVLSMSYGADDYITKPYNPTLLLLRMEAIFKRMEQLYAVLDYENIQVIPDRGVMIYQGQDYYLTKNETLIFKYLYLHRGAIVSREDIMHYLWDSEEFVDDNTLSVNMSRLRNKLKDVGLDQVIETRKGIGYLLK